MLVVFARDVDTNTRYRKCMFTAVYFSSYILTASCLHCSIDIDYTNTSCSETGFIL